MRLVEPAWLFLWLALPLLAAAAWWLLDRQRKRAERFALAPSFARLHTRVSTSRRVMAIALPLLAIACVAGALARPQAGTKQGNVERSGAAVAIVLDTSLSMATEDVPPSRFLLARRAINSLTERLAGDRVALITFAGDAQLLCPLTSDYRALDLMLDGLYPGTVGAPGSAIYRGVVNGIAALESAEEGAGKAVLLITDGEDWGGGMDQAAEKVRESGVDLIVLGVGKTEGEPIPLRSASGEFAAYKYDENGQVVISRLDEAPLRRLAEEAGGKYWPLSSNLREVPLVQKDIEHLARAQFEEGNLYRYSEQYAWFLIPALLLLWIELLWPVARQRREIAARAAASLRGAPLVVLALWLSLSGFDWRPYRDTQKGVAAYSREEYETAVEKFESALDAAPESEDKAALLHYNLGSAYFKAGRVDDAIAEWDRAANLAQDNSLKARANYNAGTAALTKAAAAAAASERGGVPGGGKGELREALQRYQNSLQLDPTDLSAKHNFEMATKYLKLLQQQQMQQQSGEDGENQDGEQQDSQSAEQMQAQKGEKQDSGEPGDEQQSARMQQGGGEESQDEQDRKKGEQQAQGEPGEEQGEKDHDSLSDRQREEGDEEQQMAGGEEQEEKPEGEESRAQSQGGQSGDESSDASQATGGAQARSAEEVSRDEAERILDALAERERELRRRERDQLQQSRGGHDW